MEATLTYCIQVNVLLLIIYLGYHVLLRGLTFYQLNRYYFILGGIFSLVYPFVNVPALFKTPIEPVGDFVSYLPGMLQEQTAKGVTISLQGVVLGIFAVGALFFMVKFGIQLLSLLRIHRHSERDSWHNYLYRNVWLPIVPFSFFNKIYLNKQQHEEVELQDIFEHEYTHVKGFHSFDILLYELLMMFCWYNPCIWLMRRAMRQNLEFLTDQEVLNAGADKQSYQYSLIHVTKQGEQIGISNQFNFKMLKKRISMMNKKRSSSIELSKYIFLLPLIIFSAAAFTVTKADAKIAEVVQFTERTQVAAIPFQPVTAVVDTVKKQKSAKDTSLHRLIVVTDSLAKQRGIVISASKKGEGTILLKSDSSTSKGRTGGAPVGTIRIVGTQGSGNGKQPLIFVDGKKMVNSFELSAIDPNEIESISVIKDAAAILKHGEEAISGVIDIKLKKEKSKSDTENKEKAELKTEKTGASAPLEGFFVPSRGEGNVLTVVSKGNAVSREGLVFSSVTKKDDAVALVAHGVERATGKVVTVRYADDQAKDSLFEGKEVTIQARKREGSVATDNDKKVIIINAVGRKTN